MNLRVMPKTLSRQKWRLFLWPQITSCNAHDLWRVAHLVLLVRTVVKSPLIPGPQFSCFEEQPHRWIVLRSGSSFAVSRIRSLSNWSGSRLMVSNSIGHRLIADRVYKHCVRSMRRLTLQRKPHLPKKKVRIGMLGNLALRSSLILFEATRGPCTGYQPRTDLFADPPRAVFLRHT